ncbi:cyclic-di-AMP receptor [Vallitalea sp.]|jgi:uncharacterized protein YaaQ|uniref:cyclic-di-AMP receptor n=1 Tax=Vallitalea sp. TaxID=1882829 RepID=UPI0025F234AA|nr:cyclic-di-AMP receptor [Vallitalea sp.]MCT4685707.1 cyclic-di-AMP receptor [Vallitalea sp.]
MKLIIAVIHDEDSHRLTEGLNKSGFMATKLASTGGFLKTGNTTILIGVPKEKVDEVIEIIKRECKTNKQMSLLNPPVAGMPDGYLPYPIEVTVGGATVFVIDVDQYYKL